MNFIFYSSNTNGENDFLTPSILEIHRIGGIFIYPCGFFYVRFVRFV
ncbi:MAG: hypothetical protein U9R01_05575 [candidate division WOR-3 bacterium]|nr:hypothetical protein [candidate division WOR-3 bacterium]